MNILNNPALFQAALFQAGIVPPTLGQSILSIYVFHYYIFDYINKKSKYKDSVTLQKPTANGLEGLNGIEYIHIQQLFAISIGKKKSYYLMDYFNAFDKIIKEDHWI